MLSPFLDVNVTVAPLCELGEKSVLLRHLEMMPKADDKGIVCIVNDDDVKTVCPNTTVHGGHCRLSIY